MVNGASLTLTPFEPSKASPTPWRGWGLVSYLTALVLAGVVGYFLFHVPFQVSDNVANMLTLRHASLGQLISHYFVGQGYVRPFLWATLKIVFDVSHGHYFLTFKAFHVLQVTLLLLLFVRALGVRSLADFAALPIALTVLLGFHTFRNMVGEAFPINTFLTILVCVMAALNLCLARPRPIVDLAASLLLIFAALTVESGLLVWVIFAAGHLVGYRGISRKGLAATTAIVAVYFCLRFIVFHVGTPGLTERPTGFGFERLEPQELVRRFGANPWPLYLYNVAASALSVLFAEPRRGVFSLTRAWFNHDVRQSMLLSVAAVSATTLLLLIYIGIHLRHLVRWRLQASDRLVLIFLAVLGANATLSFAYAKDEIMSPAGLFYAVAVYAASTELLVKGRALVSSPALSAIVGCLVVALSVAWCLRAIDLPYSLHLAALRNRTDWVRVNDWKRDNHVDATYPDGDPFIRALQSQALRMHVPNPHVLYSDWERWYSDQQ